MFQHASEDAGEDSADIRGWPRERCDRLFWGLFALLSGFHLFILLTNPLDLVSDEALYWEYSKHLDWSYYAKGPAVAIATWLGSHLLGDSVLGVRLPALICLSLFSAALYCFLRSLISPAAALFAFAAVRLSLVFAVTGFIMTTDPLILPLWLGSMIFAYRAVRGDRPLNWIPAFFLAGLAVLAKFTAVLLLPGYGLVLLLSKQHRRHLWSFGWWAAVVAFLFAISPIIIWNAQHDWVNLGHNVGHTVGKPGRIPFKHFPELVLGQLGLLGPLLFPLFCLALWRAMKRWLREGDVLTGLWVASTAPLLAVCIFVTATRSCYANWPLPAYVGGIIILAAEFQRSKNTRWFRRALLLNAAIFLVAQVSWYLPLFAPPSMPLPIPILRMTGWTELGRALEAAAAKQQETAKLHKAPFILALDYMTASSLRFTLKPEIEVRLGSFGGRRLSEQDFWQTWPELVGSDALVIGSKTAVPDASTALPWFSSCEPAALEGVPAENRMAKPFHFLLCRNYNGKLPEIARSW